MSIDSRRDWGQNAALYDIVWQNLMRATADGMAETPSPSMAVTWEGVLATITWTVSLEDADGSWVAATDANRYTFADASDTAGTKVA